MLNKGLVHSAPLLPVFVCLSGTSIISRALVRSSADVFVPLHFGASLTAAAFECSLYVRD